MSQKIYLPFKRFFDILLSLLVIILFSWLYLLLAIIIKCSSKGPVFFKQKRIGKNKKEFYILKFRTMRIDTPRDVPTHLLENPEIYITRIGKFMRKTSLDELPQVFNIFVGQMSIVGPRPALWNQFDLIEERDRYGANSIRPGLSGWAQCHGRDTLPISEKAKLDGYYFQKFNFWIDIKVIFLTAIQAFAGKDEVEGTIKDKRICIIVTVPMTIEWFVNPFATLLAKKGYVIDFICDSFEPGFEEKYPYANFIPVPMSRGISFKTFFKASKLMKKVFKKNHYKAVIYATPGAAYYASVAAKKANIKKRIFLNWGYRFVSEKNIIKRTIIKNLERKTFRNSTFTLIVSEKNKQFAIDNNFVKSTLIDVVGVGGLNGVDTYLTDTILNSYNEWHTNIKSDEKTFVFGCVARFNKDKGVNELYEAFNLFRKKHPNANVKMVFQGPVDDMDKQTENTYRCMSKDEAVILLGRQQHIDTLKIMSTFDIFVLPTYRDGFGTSLQEAMALRKPCITTNIMGPSEVIRHNVDGLLVEPRNSVDLFEKMEYLYENTELRRVYGQNAYEYAKKYYESRICVEKYADYLEKLIEE